MTGVVTVLKGSCWTSGTLLHVSAGARSLTTRVTPQPNQISSWSLFMLLSLVLIITAVRGSHTQDSYKPANLDTGSSCATQLALTCKLYFAVYSES